MCWLSACKVLTHVRSVLSLSAAVNWQTKREALREAKKDVEELIKSKHCNPIVVRLAWHDSGSYDKVLRRRLVHNTVLGARRPWLALFASTARVFS